MRVTRVNFSVLIAIICLTFAFLSTNVITTSAEALISEWSAWKAKFNKEYASAAEETRRFKIWRANRAHINSHNKKHADGLLPYSLGLNKFADQTNEEYKKNFRIMTKLEKKQRRQARLSRQTTTFEQVKAKLGDRTLPSSIDWRDYGVLNPVKDQAKCGSCYAFSTVGSMESHHAIKTGQLLNLSEQQIVDCALDEGDGGCNGGLMDYSFDYIILKGLTTEKEYPYNAKEGTCYDDKVKDVIWLHNYVDLPDDNEYALKLALALIGPASVAVDAESDFRFYTGGIFNSTQCHEDDVYLDHAVMAVGYGVDEQTGLDYWIVRNSWGDNWGEGGYIRMARTKPFNLCGIADEPSFPLL